MTDVICKRGASNMDSASSGTSLRDFLRVADFAPIPEDGVATFGDGGPAGGMAIFSPDGECIRELTSTSS